MLPHGGNEGPLIANAPRGKVPDSHRLGMPFVEEGMSALIEKKYTPVPVLPTGLNHIDTEVFSNGILQVVARQIEDIVARRTDP